MPAKKRITPQASSAENASAAPHLAWARKYRPQSLAELIGQPHVTSTLARAIANQRIGQAYLFTGQRGVGKTSAARILALSLSCANGPTATPCQRCVSCTAIRQGTSLDVLEIDGASNRGIDDIRQLREQVKLAPVHGRFRIYIIDEVHQITTDAFNALLKTLEEPPPHVKFIFATTAAQKVPATILSRCQRFDFRRLDAATVVQALQHIAEAEGLTVDDAALYAIARASEGSLRDAEVLLEQVSNFCEGVIREADVTAVLGAVEDDVLARWTQALLDRNAAAALQILTEQLDAGKELIRLAIGLLGHLRNLVVWSSATAAKAAPETLDRLVDVAPEARQRLAKQAAAATPEEWLMMAQILSSAYELARRSAFGQVVVEFALIRLATREAWASLDELVTRLEQVARAGEPHVPPSTTPARPTMTAAPTSAPAQPSSPPLRATVPTSARASAPEPAVASAIPLEDVQSHWPQVLERVGQQKMSLAAYLMDGRPTGVAGATVEIGLPAFSLHQEVLTLVENMRVVEHAFTEIFGRALRVAYTTLPEPSPGDASASAVSSRPSDVPASAPPIVQDIVQLFNATIVTRPPAASS